MARDDQTMHETYSRGRPFISGETITGGRFACRECGRELDFEPGHVVNLPVCPSCQNETWDRR
jgi:Zinc-ribbon containing domain